jgi:hypothetical protein
VRVGHLYVPADFVVVETSGDDKAPIILGQAFLRTAKAIIYTDDAKICFTIKGRKERFIFKNKTLQSPSHPQKAYIYEDKTAEKKTNRRRNKTKQSPIESVKIVNTVHTKYDYLLISPYLLKQDDPSVPTIECTINQRIFHKTFCDTRSGFNIMANVPYEYLFGKEPLSPTYVQLQMADQTF